MLTQASVNAECACSARIEQEPSLTFETFHNVSSVRSSPLPVQSQQFQDHTRVDGSSLSREQTSVNKSPLPSKQDNPSLPLTQANLFLLGGSQSSSSVVSTEASEASSQSRSGTGQRSEQSQSTDEMVNTVMQIRHLLQRNRHFINHRFTDDPEGAERCKAFKSAGYKIIDEKRVSDWSPVKASEVQEIIYTYQNEPEATFLFFIWQALLNKSRHTYQRPYEGERSVDMERWMEQSWTKDHLRYKFNIDFARDSVPPLIPANDYEKKLLSNTPRVTNPKPDIAFALYKDAFNPIECEIFEQNGCTLTGNGSYHEFASLDAKSINASIEEAENQCARSGSAMVFSRRKLNDLYAKCPQPSITQPSNQPAMDLPSLTQPFSIQASALPPPSTETKSKIKLDTLIFTLAFATGLARLFVNWDLDQDGSTQWHMHVLRNYNYDNFSDLTQLHHDIDNIMEWGVAKRKDRIQNQTAWIIQNKVVPSVSKRSPHKRKLDEAESE